MSEFYDKTLHHLGRLGVKPSIVVIGAMDGHSFDDMTDYFSMYHWDGLFVEPIPYQFNALKEYHKSLDYITNSKYENCAIMNYSGTVKMLTIDTDAMRDGLIHPCFGGMSAAYPPKNGLGSVGDFDTVKKYGSLVEVACKKLQTVLDEHDIRHIDIMQVDAEGSDWIILQQLDFSIYRPKLIRSEFINIDSMAQTEMINYFTENGYDHIFYGQDIDFVDKSFWASFVH